jgi:hypothetical protein
VLVRNQYGAMVTHRYAADRELILPVSDALSRGWSFIMFGTPEYERALVEAARIDDGIKSLSASSRTLTFTGIVPAVAQHRKTDTPVRYSAGSAVLPAPFFPYPVNPNDEGMSQALRAIAESQQKVITSWDEEYGTWYVTAPSTVDVRDENGYDRDKKSIKALAAYARASGTKLTAKDFQIVSRAYILGAVVEHLKALAKWPADLEQQLAAAASLEDLDALEDRLTVEAYDFVELPAEGDLSAWMGFLQRSQFNRRRTAIQAEARRAEMAAQGVALPPATAQAAGVAANATGKIGIKGDTRPHKEVIKEAARRVGGKPYWNGDKLMWEVPAETWDYLVANHPQVAAVLQPVPA